MKLAPSVEINSCFCEYANNHLSLNLSTLFVSGLQPALSLNSKINPSRENIEVATAAADESTDGAQKKTIR